MTIHEFIAQHGVKMTATRVDSNPALADDQWAREASHYRCTIRAHGKRMQMHYSMGSAHTKAPNIADVLDCLASDAYGLPLPEMAGSEDEAFAEWCREYDYDPDSRKALKAYRATLRQTRALGRLFSPSEQATLFECERL